MSLNLIKVFGAGRLTKKPELKTTPAGKYVTSFSIAVNGKNDAQYFDCAAYDSCAEFVTKHFDRGSAIWVEGKLRNRSWTDKNNQTHYVTEIVADRVDFVESKAAPAFHTAEQAAYAEANFEEIDLTSDDLPF